MKAFAFRLDQARHWRETQTALWKARVALAAGKAAAVERALAAENAERLAGAEEIAANPEGPALRAYSSFADLSGRRTAELEEKLKAVRGEVAGALEALVAANRGLRLLENLKAVEFAGWRRERDAETAKFADEAFSARYNRQNRRARSSGG